jgi:hypothetical protein
MRALIFLLALLPSSFVPAWSGALTGIVALPNQPTVTALQQDAAGNLYIAGPYRREASSRDYPAKVRERRCRSGDQNGTVRCLSPWMPLSP